MRILKGDGAMEWYRKGGKVLVPPFNFGRNVDDDAWNKTFPDGPKRSFETEEEYEARRKAVNERQ